MRYTFVKQFDSSDCAAACLAMICLYYHKETSISDLRERMGTDLKGTNLIGLGKCADSLGFVSQAVRVDRGGFLSDFTLPCIANVLTKDGLSHFVVVFKKTEKYVIIGDPGKDLMRITVDDFFKMFTGVVLILKPDERFETGKKEKSSLFRQYLKLLLPHKKLFVYAILASLITTVLGIVTSMFNKVLMDEILPYRLENTLLMTLIIFTGISLVSIFVSFERQFILLYLSQKIDIPLMMGYFRHIFRLPMNFFATRKTGDIITRFSDAGTIKGVFTSIALSLVLDVSMALISAVVLFQMQTKLFVIILIMTLINLLLVVIYKPIYKNLNEEAMQQGAAMNSEIIEGLRSFETIKGNAIEEHELNNIEKEYIRSLRLGFRSGKISSIQSLISGIISAVGGMVMAYAGISTVLSGAMTIGSYMAFSTLAGYFTGPVSNLIGMQMQIQEAQISIRRLSEIMDAKEEEEKDREDAEIKEIGDVEIKDIVFRYGNRHPALNHVSFCIPKGSKVALVGSSGSGKSTLAKLLLKFYVPESGEILFDGRSTAEYNASEIRRAIAYVPQNIELFSKSILENIRVTKPGATLEEVKEAAKLAEAHEFIQSLPGQYSTVLEEAGNGLSGGEKQRIVLSRAFLKDSSFYILDESTSSLDFITENLIFDLIYNKLRRKSMLIIAHRLATVRNCDLILVMSHGEIIERGTHDELLAFKGEYWRLWEMQQGNFIKREENTGQEAAAVPPVSEETGEEEMTYYG